MHQNGNSNGVPLSIWDQASSRVHVRAVLCFPLPNESRERAISHLQTALVHLAHQHPDFAGKLHLGHRKGWVCLSQSPNPRIPFEIFNIEDSFDYTYSELRDQHFPPGAFVHPQFACDGDITSEQDRVPVAIVRAYFVDGGLLIALFFHHSFGDGEALRLFMECFAAHSRREYTAIAGTRSLDFARHSRSDKRRPVEQLFQKCDEFMPVSDMSGPNQPTLRPGGKPLEKYNKTGKTFVFERRALQRLKDAAMKTTDSTRQPSAYTCLAAIHWAHAAKARMQIEKHPRASCAGAAAGADGIDGVDCHDDNGSAGGGGWAMLMNPVNWRTRAFQGKTGGYFGNAAALAITRVPIIELIRATESIEGMARLVRRIEKGIQAVDEDFVRKRIELFDTVPDPRNIGLTLDPRVPQDLAFNTWRSFGADTEWDICGDGIMKPDVVRRAQDVWNMGGTLILPSREGSTVYEVLLTIPQSSMDLLCKDTGFLGWTSRVVG